MASWETDQALARERVATINGMLKRVYQVFTESHIIKSVGLM